MKLNRGKLDLIGAVEAYAKGSSVVVFDDAGAVLHGRETLELIKSAGIGLDCLVIRDVNSKAFDDSHWPEILEAARRVFMKDGGYLLNARRDSPPRMWS